MFTHKPKLKGFMFCSQIIPEVYIIVPFIVSWSDYMNMMGPYICIFVSTYKKHDIRHIVFTIYKTWFFKRRNEWNYPVNITIVMGYTMSLYLRWTLPSWRSIVTVTIFPKKDHTCAFRKTWDINCTLLSVIQYIRQLNPIL